MSENPKKLYGLLIKLELHFKRSNYVNLTIFNLKAFF